MRYVTLQLFLFFSQALGAKIHQVSWRSRRNASRIALSEGVDGSQRPPFEGIGALSAGASSRLLQDYPETQRNEILDLLFKPQYGASLQVLKVEIGGDTQSTDGSEPSHMRYRGERPDCSRGYEAWLLQEAKARNPLIRTYALAWGVPGWIGNGTFFSEDNIHYHVSWLKCIKERYDIDIDYMGLWNEMPWGDVWYVFDLASAIKDAELNTQLVLLVMAPLWTSAHTTQFTKLGWNYLPVGDAAGILPEGGTYVTIASSDLSDFTIVIETLTGRCMYHDGCFHTKTPQEVQHLEFQLSDNLTAAARGRDLEVWVTNASHWFRRLEDLRVDEGIVRISMEVDAILTISTLQEATKQGQRASTPKDVPEIPQQAAFPLPFEEAFDAVQLHRSPPFFADQGGTFEVVEDMDLVRGTRLNRVLQQQVLQVPIGWSGAAPEPLTLFGGTNWTDVDVEVLARFEGPTSGKFTPLQPFGHQSVHLSLLEEGKKRSPKARYVGLCARVLRYTFFNTGGKPQGYCLQVTEDGLGAMWTLTASSEVLAAGPLSETSKEKIARKEWLQLRLEVSKARIRALIDGETVSNIIDTSLPMGQVALNCGYHKCQFDNIKVLPSSKNVTSFLATTSRELLKMYSPVTFHYDARTCDPSPAQTPKRDDFTGFVGLAFVPQVAVRLAALGRMVLRGGPPVAAAHNVELLEVDGKQLKYVASAAVPTTPSQQVGIIATDEGFQYAELRESVLLEPGHKYVLASSEISGGDFFYDKAVVAEASEGVQILGPAYSNQSGWTFDSEPNLLFGPLNALLIPAEAQTQQLFTPVADPEKAKHAASGPAFVMKSQESKATSTAEAEAEDEAAPASPQWEVELVEDQTLSTLDLSPS